MTDTSVAKYEAEYEFCGAVKSALDAVEGIDPDADHLIVTDEMIGEAKSLLGAVENVIDTLYGRKEAQETEDDDE